MGRLTALLVALGLGVSGLLLQRHLELVAGSATRSVCSTVLHVECDAALTGPLSMLLGLPLAGWGLAYFGTLATLLLVGETIGGAPREVAWRTSLALAVIAATAGVALCVAMVTSVVAFCPLCVAVHMIDFALVPVLSRAGGGPIRDLPRRVRAATALLVRRGEPLVADHRTAGLGMVASGLAAVVILQAVSALDAQHRRPTPDVRAAVGAYALAQRWAVSVDEQDARLGSADADLHMVVFSDFECVACRAFSKRLAELASTRAPRIDVAFKHYPASTRCNPGVEEDLHPHACGAATAAEAARVQGRFWEFHDALFAADGPPDEEALMRAAAETGLDLARFEVDRRSDAARRKVSDDVSMGIALGVDETPTVFLNGRRVPDISGAALHMIIMSEIAAHTPAKSVTAESPPGSPEDPEQIGER